ncbi:MAG: HAD family hydrolase [bacterium]|nr:HAD family hydrolase [bacterium]
MTLVVFDIDGTLTATCDCDADCYAAAFADVFGIPLPTTDWHVYEHVTDTGVMEEVLMKHRGTSPSPEEIDLFERTFEAKLRAEYAANPGAFGEVPGAKALLDDLAQREGFQVALATGGMRRSAQYKLSVAGIDAQRLPGGYANDSISREGIARHAIAAASNGNGADDVVYVGDGAWDARTSAALGMRFVGITHESCPDLLRATGGTVFIPDYADLEAFYDAVRAASVPVVPGC